MRTVGLMLLVSGLASAAVLFTLGECCVVPWSTGSAVLFGLGVAYAGLCSVNSAAAPREAAP